MEITEYFGCGRKERLLSELGKCEWEAGKLLYDLLKSGTAETFLGEKPRIFMLTEGDRLVSFCTLARKDDIPDCELSPWIGFVYAGIALSADLSRTRRIPRVKKASAEFLFRPDIPDCMKNMDMRFVRYEKI